MTLLVCGAMAFGGLLVVMRAMRECAQRNERRQRDGHAGNAFQQR